MDTKPSKSFERDLMRPARPVRSNTSIKPIVVLLASETRYLVQPMRVRPARSWSGVIGFVLANSVGINRTDASA